jgi:hypothetical protein
MPSSQRSQVVEEEDGEEEEDATEAPTVHVSTLGAIW